MPADHPARPGIGTREGPLTEHEAAAQSYQDSLGWTVGVFGSGVWLVTDRVVDALDMPKELGKRTWTVLNAPVPLFESPNDDSVRWVFLTLPHRGPAVPELAELDVDHIRSGRSLDLPPSRFGRHQVRWITWPIRPLPAFQVVADAALRAAKPH